MARKHVFVNLIIDKFSIKCISRDKHSYPGVAPPMRVTAGLRPLDTVILDARMSKSGVAEIKNTEQKY